METNNQPLQNVQEVKELISPFAKVTESLFMTPTIGKISEAIAISQLNLEKVLKNTNNAFFRSKYADLATVIEVTKEFAKNGIAITQHPFESSDGKKVGVTTILSHSSGESMGSTLEMFPVETIKEKNGDTVFLPITQIKPQTIGATITYIRRYALAALANVAQEDDDGNIASGRPQTQTSQQPEQRQNIAPSQTAQPQQKKPEPQPAQPQKQQPAPQKTAEEQLMTEKKVRLEKLPGMISQNEWFALDIEASPKFGKPSGKAGMQEIVKFVCNSKERVDPASMTIEQIDEVLRLANYICEFFKNGGQPGAGPADVWIGNMHKALNNPDKKEVGKYDMF